MRGQHRVHFEPSDQRVLVTGAELGVPEAGDRRGQRLADRCGAGVALAQGADPLLFLGQVGQVEVDGERSGYRLGPAERPALHQRGDLVVGFRAGRQPRGDDPVPQILDVIEQILTCLLADDLAEDLAQQPDVPPHGRRELPAVGVAGVGLAGRCAGH